MTGIIYSLVSRGQTILSDFATSTGNFQQISYHILEKIPEEGDSKMTFVYDSYLFHYIKRSGIIYMAMADDDLGRRIPFAFLDTISKRFESKHAEFAKTATVNELAEEFGGYLASQMEFFSSDVAADRIRGVQNEIQVCATF
jgi:vesicle-associated membrane protein 7